MTDKTILLWPNKALSKVCEPVTEFDTKLTQLVINLHETMKKHDEVDPHVQAAGLAAPQIGVYKRVFVYKLDGEPTCMINPEILESEGSEIAQEGCLSFPGYYQEVERATKILVEFQDVDGNKNRIRTEGFTARCIQHEIDHLDGKTFIHDLSKLKKDIVTRRMKKVQKGVDQLRKRFQMALKA